MGDTRHPGKHKGKTNEIQLPAPGGSSHGSSHKPKPRGRQRTSAPKAGKLARASSAVTGAAAGLLTGGFGGAAARAAGRSISRKAGKAIESAKAKRAKFSKGTGKMTTFADRRGQETESKEMMRASKKNK